MKQRICFNFVPTSKHKPHAFNTHFDWESENQATSKLLNNGRFYCVDLLDQASVCFLLAALLFALVLLEKIVIVSKVVSIAATHMF